MTLINGAIAPQRIDDLSTLFARLGWRHSVELSDENENVVEGRSH